MYKDLVNQELLYPTIHPDILSNYFEADMKMISAKAKTDKVFSKELETTLKMEETYRHTQQEFNKLLLAEGQKGKSSPEEINDIFKKNGVNGKYKPTDRELHDKLSEMQKDLINLSNRILYKKIVLTQKAKGVWKKKGSKYGKGGAIRELIKIVGPHVESGKAIYNDSEIIKTKKQHMIIQSYYKNKQINIRVSKGKNRTNKDKREILEEKRRKNKKYDLAQESLPTTLQKKQAKQRRLIDEKQYIESLRTLKKDVNKGMMLYQLIKNKIKNEEEITHLTTDFILKEGKVFLNEELSTTMQDLITYHRGLKNRKIKTDEIEPFVRAMTVKIICLEKKKQNISDTSNPENIKEDYIIIGQGSGVLSYTGTASLRKERELGQGQSKPKGPTDKTPNSSPVSDEESNHLISPENDEGKPYENQEDKTILDEIQNHQESDDELTKPLLEDYKNESIKGRLDRTGHWSHNKPSNNKAKITHTNMKEKSDKNVKEEGTDIIWKNITKEQNQFNSITTVKHVTNGCDAIDIRLSKGVVNDTTNIRLDEDQSKNLIIKSKQNREKHTEMDLLQFDDENDFAIIRLNHTKTIHDSIFQDDEILDFQEYNKVCTSEHPLYNQGNKGTSYGFPGISKIYNEIRKSTAGLDTVLVKSDVVIQNVERTEHNTIVTNVSGNLYPGMSGGPVLVKDGKRYYIIGNNMSVGSIDNNLITKKLGSNIIIGRCKIK